MGKGATRLKESLRKLLSLPPREIELLEACLNYGYQNLADLNKQEDVENQLLFQPSDFDELVEHCETSCSAERCVEITDVRRKQFIPGTGIFLEKAEV